WLKTPEEMRRLFADLPEACDNTIEIARRSAVAFKKTKPMLPPYPGLHGRTEEEALREQAAAGLEARIASKGFAPEKRKEYADRLAFELDVIVQMGFAGYF